MISPYKKLFIITSLFLLIAGCNSKSARPLFVATSHPISEIIRELSGPTIVVHTLVPPNASPHTFEPKPADIYKLQAAEALFYVSPQLDVWAEKLEAKNKIQLLSMVPEELLLDFGKDEHNHKHSGETHIEKKNKKGVNDKTKKIDKNRVYDPHFWMDPLVVKAILPALADTLTAIDPENAAKYKANAKRFADRLDVLNKQVSSELQSVAGKPVFLFHPSIRYLLKRYKLVYAGAIEEFPGKEPSPKYIAELSNKIKANRANAVFTEPQLPEAPAKTISEVLGINLYTLDPIGGVEGRMRYTELILYNAKTLKKALK